MWKAIAHQNSRISQRQATALLCLYGGGSADEERICFMDTYYGPDYNEGELKEKVDSFRAPILYCDADRLEYEAENREIKYYLFERA